MIDLSSRSVAPHGTRSFAALLASLAALATPAAPRANETAAPELVASVSTLVAPPTHIAEPVPAPQIVAEAFFLRDDLPPGGRDLNVSIGFAEGEPDAETGRTSYAASPRLQLAMALGERVGFTADAGLVNDGAAFDTPGASLKVLLRTPDVEKTGIAASLDLFGSTHSLEESEAGFGVGAIRSFGRFALRAAVGGASGVASWSPHVHGGVSGALALGKRWRFLGEVVADVAGGEVALSAGPTVKMAIGETTALMVGALFQVEPSAAPAFAVQLTSAL